MEKTIEIETPVAAPVSVARTSGAVVIAAYAATIFFSAFLLFQVQPLISKFILPWFGGSPAVWTAAMLFFQLVLFGGYLYAHLTSTYLSFRLQFLVHAGLLAIAAAVALYTQISPGESFKPRGDADESPLLQILLLLAATVGLPYFVLSSTGPLLQKWFSDAFEGASPYRLFALSNLGSLLALLSYPFFFEVWWDSREQALFWSFAFAGFAACCAYCAWWTYQARLAHADRPRSHVTSKPKDVPPSALLRTAWVALPALASIMFLAVTNEVTQNVATVPLLWIIPLSLYLLSFIVAFDHPRWYSRPIYAVAAVVLLVYMADFPHLSRKLSDLINGVFGLSGDNEVALRHNWVWQCGVYFAGLFLVCMICHCELAALKPTPRYLTSFFLSMSLGGAMGGIFVNLIAPYTFTTFFELPLGLIASLVIAVYLVYYAFQSRGWRVPGVAAGLLGAGAVLWVVWDTTADAFEAPDPTSPIVYQGRSFYGLVSARHNDTDTPREAFLTFKSGHIAHGRQWSHPDRQRETAIAYWGPDSGCRRALEHATAKYPNCRIGVVGLGIGTIAGFAKKGQYVRMYEINPQVVDIAQNHFYYLKNCEAKYDIVLGDARLQLERELRETGSHQFDVLCLDAFSGDAVPMHLLTSEAFELYKQHLKPNGIIVANVTNTYLDLYPVITKLAETHGYKHTRVLKRGNSDALCFRTYFVLLTNDEEFLQKYPEDMEDAKKFGPEFLVEREAPLWTDRYHSLWHVLQ